MTPPTLAVATDWFTVEEISPLLSLVSEPHVKPLLAANTWVIHGRDRDLVIDSGLGVASLRSGVPQLFERTPALVVTHGHLDHLGGAHEFEDVWAHPAERIERSGRGSLLPQELCEVLGAPDGSFGYDVLLDAVPDAGFDPRTYDLRPVTPSRALGEGDVVDLGDLRFRVLHLPGHTPGSIGLYEPDVKMLVSGDVVYDDDDGMIDFLDESSPRDYRATMRRLLELDVETVVPGHGDRFGQERLVQIAEDYLGGSE
jgi:glyoxylase-like metal-dependent hydrolase (beta-lactamase superfamily II)